MRPMGSAQHVPPPRPLRFDSYDPEWDLGQSSRHLNLCFLLRELLLRAVTPNDTVGTDAFTYFDETDPKKKCAPDAFVKLGVPKAHYESWLTWHQGAPELCIEILSPSDTKEAITPETKLHVGALADEPVALFLADDEAGDGRVLTNDEARIVAEEGRRFFEAKWIAAEEARRAAEEARQAAEATAIAESDARKVAEARIRELEDLIRAKG